MSYPTVRIIDDGPQLPVADVSLLPIETLAEAAALAWPDQHVMMRFGERIFSLPTRSAGPGAYSGTIVEPRPFDWRLDAPEFTAREFPPLVFGGRGTVLTEDVLEEVRTRLHRRLSAGDVDSGLWER